MMNTGFVYQTNPAFFVFLGPNPRLSCNIKEKTSRKTEQVVREAVYGVIVQNT
jgi:hypothetical protein